METNLIPLGIDAGNGAFKIFGEAGGVELLSQIATNGAERVMSTLGLRRQKPPMQIINESGSFYVGAGAHDYGRPVENLDVDRLNGSPEIKTLLHGSLTRFQQEYGLFTKPLSVVVGLPNESLTGESADQNKENVRRWVKGVHSWSADGKDQLLDIAEVKVASQVTGGLFDYLLDDNGHFIPERKKAFTGEVGVISIGFGTVELMVVRNRMPVQRFTYGVTAGVRRLLEILNSQQLYSLGELDLLLRAGQLDLRTALPIWEQEVRGVIEKQWGKSWKRFAAILLVGGGAILLKDTLPYHFGGKAFIPDDPVQTIARGLFKLNLMQLSARREK